MKWWNSLRFETVTFLNLALPFWSETPIYTARHTVWDVTTKWLFVGIRPNTNHSWRPLVTLLPLAIWILFSCRAIWTQNLTNREFACHWWHICVFAGCWPPVINPGCYQRQDLHQQQKDKWGGDDFHGIYVAQVINFCIIIPQIWIVPKITFCQIIEFYYRMSTNYHNLSSFLQARKHNISYQIYGYKKINQVSNSFFQCW